MNSFKAMCTHVRAGASAQACHTHPKTAYKQKWMYSNPFKRPESRRKALVSSRSSINKPMAAAQLASLTALALAAPLMLDSARANYPWPDKVLQYKGYEKVRPLLWTFLYTFFHVFLFSIIQRRFLRCSSYMTELFSTIFLSFLAEPSGGRPSVLLVLREPAEPGRGPASGVAHWRTRMLQRDGPLPGERAHGYPRHQRTHLQCLR